MKNEIYSTDLIGLTQDFSDLLIEINKLDFSSDNWFQQYKIEPNESNLRLSMLDELSSNNHWSEYSRNSSCTKNRVIPLSNEEFIEKYKERFFLSIKKSPIYKGEDNEMSLLFHEMLDGNKVTTLHILNDLFINNIDDEMICVKILSLCNDYSYNELNPTAQTLAALSLNHKSNRVRSAAMNLFSHWGTYDAYNLLCSIICPDDPWIKMKYQTIKKALEQRWFMQER